MIIEIYDDINNFLTSLQFMGMHSSAIWEIPEFLDPRINRGIFPFFLNAFLSGRKFGENKTIKRI